jgi:hypothetical protein
MEHGERRVSVSHVATIVRPVTTLLKLTGYFAVGAFALLGAVSLVGVA